MTVNCNCDMPWFAYLDWLEDQGWDVSELRKCVSDETLQDLIGNLRYSELRIASRYGCGHGYGGLITSSASGNGYSYAGAVGGHTHDTDTALAAGYATGCGLLGAHVGRGYVYDGDAFYVRLVTYTSGAGTDGY